MRGLEKSLGGIENSIISMEKSGKKSEREK